MKIFSTKADLVAASLTAGQLTSTKGYTTAGDGGGATYLIKTAVDYAGTPDEYGDHSLANGNVAVLQTEGSVNVKQYGAVGDGVTDDTLSIQAAINTLKRVYIPEGVFKIGTITVPDNSNIVGAGMYLTVLKVNTGVNGIESLGGFPSGFVTITLSDFTIESEDGYSLGARTGYGISIEACVDSSFNNILIQYFQYGIYARSSWDLSFPLVKIYNCQIGFKVPRLGVDTNASFNSISFGTFVSEANTVCGMSLGYGANISIQAAQVENQNVGFYFADTTFIDIGTTYWEWAASVGGDYVYLIGQDEGGDHGTPEHLSIRNVMTSSFIAGVAIKNTNNVFFSGELRYSDFVLSGVSNFRFEGSTPKANFSAYQNGDAASVTGDGTAYTVICDTELFDDGNYYNNATGIFTAPETGKYLLTAQAYIGNMAAAHDSQELNIITTGRTYNYKFKTFDATNGTAEQALHKSVIVNMTAGDTAYMSVNVTGNPVPAKQVFVFGGSSTTRTMFSGSFLAHF